MVREAVLHRMDVEGAYALNKHLLLLKLRAKRGDLQRVEVVYGDMYQWMHQREDKDRGVLQKVASDQLFDYFEIVLDMRSRIALYYYFVLDDGKQILYYGHYDFFEEAIADGKFMFVMHYMRQEDRIVVPDWARDAIVYEIFPDRFRNGKAALNPPDVRAWDCDQSGQYIYLGGDLPGVLQKLDYLENLGINTIYLTPIFKGGSNHRYNTFDYYEIDPYLGTKADLIELVQKAHQKGIRIVLDAVFNHCGIEFFAFQDVLKKGESSDYVDWFRIHHFPVEVRDFPDYECYGYYGYMPRFNFSNSEVREYLLQVAEYWIREADIDGWRLDVAPEVDHDFWREFRKRVKALKSDLLIVGEVWHDTSAWLRGDEFDCTMNYRFMEAALDYVTEKISAEGFLNTMASIRGQYALPVYYSVWNLVGSHDTERYLNRIQGNQAKNRIILALLFGMPGVPMIYYGDEVGMRSDKNHNRAGMIWDSDKQNTEILDEYRKWIALRKKHSSLRQGEWKVPEYESNDVGVLVFLRTDDRERILTIINRSDSESELRVFVSGKWKNVFGKDSLDSEKNLSLTLAPFDVWVLVQS